VISEGVARGIVRAVDEGRADDFSAWLEANSKPPPLMDALMPAWSEARPEVAEVRAEKRASAPNPVEADHYWPGHADADDLPQAIPPELPPFEPTARPPAEESDDSFTFGGVTIRVTPDGRMVAIDILRALGQKDPRNAWKSLKKQYPDIVQESCTFAFGRGGRSPQVLTERGVYKLAMVAGGPKAAQFREWAARQLQRIRTADPAALLALNLERAAA
jgi:hypothetical protein